ncbi:Cryptic sugar kinase Mak [hydrothermal vent metagenome]|uniref:Cryptic sugar kinase Mak n=1 Tax=hydrothermal vent metagenome TaxID=652676 RepID=A0A3B0X3C5_9ZZZZ
MKIGIDLGGTKIEGIALDAKGNELLRYRVATPVGDYHATLQSMAGLIEHIEAFTGESGTVGVGTPGAISPESGVLRNSNSVCMNGQRVKEDLQALLKRKIRMSNDANCFVLSEATDGAAKGAAVVFGVIIGTGTGAGVVVNGRVLSGSNAIAGEWGHNPLPWAKDSERPGASCYCGKCGCIETFLSGPGLLNDYRANCGARALSKKITTAGIVKLAGSGDQPAEACLQRYEDRLARGLAHIINILDPDVIVLGGGMSNILRLYRNVPKIWTDYVFADSVNTGLLAPMYGDSSGVRGAAWLWD